MKTFLQHILNEIGDTAAGTETLRSYVRQRLPQIARNQEILTNRVSGVTRLKDKWKETGDEKYRQKAISLLSVTNKDSARVKKKIVGVRRAMDILSNKIRKNEPF